MAHEKLCVFCKHGRFNTAGCWGDYPDPATFECSKAVFKQEVSLDYDISIFREAILTAGTCKHYKPPKGM